MENQLSVSTLTPKSLDEAMKFAELMSKSSIVPKDFQNNPGNILVAVQWGMEIGLQPLQAMQNIAVINGRPALWGDSVIALVRSSPLCEYVREEATEHSATCTVKRRGEAETSRTFTMDQAKKAGLLGKQGPWSQYPQRMMQMRARSWALRDVFPDVLRGMPVAEEVMDIPTEREVNPNAPAARIKTEDTYQAFEDHHLPVLRDAAIDGLEALKAAFSIIPACTDKQTLWSKHGADLKAAAQVADVDHVAEILSGATDEAEAIDGASHE